MATGERELKEIGWTIGAQFAEGNVIQTEILGPRKDIRIGLNAGNQFAQDDAEAKDVTALVVPFAFQTFRRHPVRASDRWQTVTIPRNNADTHEKTNTHTSQWVSEREDS